MKRVMWCCSQGGYRGQSSSDRQGEMRRAQAGGSVKAMRHSQVLTLREGRASRMTDRCEAQGASAVTPGRWEGPLR